MYLYLRLFLLASSVQLQVQCYNILGILPHQSKSHSALMSALINELVDRGHHVTLISYAAQQQARDNLWEIVLLPPTTQSSKDNITLAKYTDLNLLHHYNIMREVNLVHDLAKDACKNGIFEERIQDLIKLHHNQTSYSYGHRPHRFDLVVLHAFNTDCFLGLVHRLQVPFLQLSTTTMFTWFHNRFGITFNPAFNPHVWMGTTGKMSFLERMVNTLVDAYSKLMYFYLLQPRDYELAKEAFGKDLPPLEVIAEKASLILEHTHFSLMPPRALNPGHVQICGFHIPKKVEPLEKNIEKWITESKEGVIYFSMGSMIKGHTFPEEKRKIFLKAFGRLKQRVLWKWENETMPDKPDNVMILKWMPQFDILCHPNVKAFISHGGLLGTTEAVHCGVPAVVMPQFGDQHTNARALEAGGGGVVLNFREADEEMVYNALTTVLDPQFNIKAKELSARFRDRPMSPMDTAIYWIEYVARHKGAHHMRTAAVGMPLYQYLLLDVIGFLALCIITALVVIIYVTKFVYRTLVGLLVGAGNNKKVKKN